MQDAVANIVTVLLSGGLALAGTLYAIRAERRKRASEARLNEASAEKVQAETEDTEANTAQKVYSLYLQLCDRVTLLEEAVEKLKKENGRLGGLLSRAHKRIAELMAGIEILIRQLEQHEIPPDYTPKDWKEEE